MTTKKLKECSGSLEEKLLGEPMSFGKALTALRSLYDLSLVELSKKVGMSKQHICDIEKERRFVSIEKAAEIARKLGHPAGGYFVRLAIQDQVRHSGLRYKVSLEDAA